MSWGKTVKPELKIRRKIKRNVVRLKSSNAMLDSADVQIKENERVWCFNVNEKRYREG